MSDRKTDTTMAGAEATKAMTALEIDRLRKDVAFWIEQSDIWKRVANDERTVTNRLRTAVKNAPHAAECEQWDLQPQTGRPLTDVCTCWKASAL